MTAETEPLKNGSRLPEHPSDTTSLKIVKYGEVRDSHSGVLCAPKLHNSDVSSLKAGNKSLSHLHLFKIENGRIWHTRSRVTITVECEPLDD
jgi:hypothetical protein